MNITKTIIFSLAVLFSTTSAFAQESDVDHAVHHTSEEKKTTDANDKSTSMTKNDDMQDHQAMTPEQCQSMMKAHDATMKMDAKMMENMKKCKMMKINP